MMTRADQKILFTALAFFAVTGRQGTTDSVEAADDIRKLAGLAESFCVKNLSGLGGAGIDETGSLPIDERIERHVRELRDDEITRLPEDMEALIQLHDRLLQRKARRSRREFYATATEATIADWVLKLLDEEIDVDRAKLA
jgi:hypothetical protein